MLLFVFFNPHVKKAEVQIRETSRRRTQQGLEVPPSGWKAKPVPDISTSLTEALVIFSFRSSSPFGEKPTSNNLTFAYTFSEVPLFDRNKRLNSVMDFANRICYRSSLVPA